MMIPFNSISSTRALCLLAGSVGHFTEHGQLGELMIPQWCDIGLGIIRFHQSNPGIVSPSHLCSFSGTFFSWAWWLFSARFFCKEQFNVTRLSSKDVGIPMIAGASASVMKKISSVLVPLNSHVIAHLPCCFILAPPYAMSTVGDCWTASGLGKPSGLRYYGYIQRYSRKGSMLPWAPLSNLAFSVAGPLLSLRKSMPIVTNTSSSDGFLGVIAPTVMDSKVIVSNWSLSFLSSSSLQFLLADLLLRRSLLVERRRGLEFARFLCRPLVVVIPWG